MASDFSYTPGGLAQAIEKLRQWQEAGATVVVMVKIAEGIVQGHGGMISALDEAHLMITTPGSATALNTTIFFEDFRRVGLNDNSIALLDINTDDFTQARVFFNRLE